MIEGGNGFLFRSQSLYKWMFKFAAKYAAFIPTDRKFLLKDGTLDLPWSLLTLQQNSASCYNVLITAGFKVLLQVRPCLAIMQWVGAYHQNKTKQKNKMFMKTTFISRKKHGVKHDNMFCWQEKWRERDSFSFLRTHHICQQGSLKELAIAIGNSCSSCHAQTLMQIPCLRMLTFTEPNQGPATRNLPSILHGRVTFLKPVILHRELPFNCH